MKKKILELYEIKENNVKEIKNIRIDNYNNQYIKIYDKDLDRTLFKQKDNKQSIPFHNEETFVVCYNSERFKGPLNENPLWSKMREGDKLFVEAADHISRKAIVREVVYLDEPRRLVVLDYLIHGDWKKVVFIAPPQGPGVEIPGVGWVGISTNPKKSVRVHKLKDELNKNLENIELLEKRNLEIIKELHINGIEI